MNSVYLVDSPSGNYVVKFTSTGSPRESLVYSDPKVVSTGFGLSGEEYVYYSDLRHYISLPIENGELTFMEYGGNKVASGIKSAVAKKLAQSRIKKFMLSRGYSERANGLTKNEFNQNRHYLDIDGELAVFDIPFTRNR